MTIRNYSNTAAQSTLSAAIAATDTSITLINYVGDPTPPFTAALARGTANEEIILVTAVAGSVVTVTRGYDGTTAKAQSAGATFQEVVVALDFREANAHVNSGSLGAHGTTSQIVGVSDAQTLTNKTLTAPAISNPTITGTETVATSNITTLNVSGVSTLTSLATTGNATVGGTLGVTGATTLAAVTATTLAASGLASLNGGATVPTGKKVTLTDAPSATTDAANKQYVDGKTWPTSAISDAASAATPSVAVKRDAAGRAQVVSPSVAADIATKGYVDGQAAQINNATAMRVATGTGTAVFSGSSFAQVTISYSAGFTSAPVVMAMANDGGSTHVFFAATAVGTTATTFVALCASNLTGNVTFNWIAVGS